MASTSRKRFTLAGARTTSVPSRRSLSMVHGLGREGLQFGHGIHTVEAPIPGLSKRQSFPSFNSATTLSPWRVLFLRVVGRFVKAIGRVPKVQSQVATAEMIAISASGRQVRLFKIVHGRANACQRSGAGIGGHRCRVGGAHRRTEPLSLSCVEENAIDRPVRDK